MSVTRSRAIVLRRTDFGEADRVVQFITENGKISALARGVRREKSKLAGGIELLAVSDVTLHSGKGELAIVTSARLEVFFAHILEDYDKLQFAYFVLKDIARAADQLDEPDFFGITETALASLNDAKISLEITELWYRIQMAATLGVGVNTTRDASGMKLVEDATYRFEPSDMSFTFDPQGVFASDHIKVLRVASVYTPEVVAHIKGIGNLIGECLAVARAAHE